ncbi:beta strand repeat-containing protein [Marmoricola sp. RAF53]|uniref:beta strand repeat-containing protein n=1 Tax=Marmoricola sp. RAF53 TaxID=3233059 RepID=UPI003F9927B1
MARGRAGRARLSAATVLALAAGSFLTVVAGAPAAQAVQATGDDVAAWQNGYAWTYGNTSFNYNDGNGTNVTINETVTYSVVGQETFQGHDAYKLNIAGTITGGSGTANAGGTAANLDTFSGTVSGVRYVRRSDLALLQENQFQHLNAKAHVSIITQGITADIELHLTPNPSWKVHDFPLNAGDSWHTLTDVAYTGGFTYDAGSIGGSGSSPFDGTLHYDAPANVTAATVNAMGNASLPVKRVYSQNADASMSDDSYWSSTYKNQVKETLVLPLDGAAMTLSRTMTSASIGGGTPITATATPSYSCGGGAVTVSGNLTSGAAGQTITGRVDSSQASVGSGNSATAVTGANGAFTMTLTAPGVSDGLDRAGAQPSRGNYGILLTGGGGIGATTVVVSPKDCTRLTYTGAVSGPQTGTATVSAQLENLADQSKAAGKTVTFTLSSGATVNATTNAAGVASTTIAVNGPVRSATISANVAGTPVAEAAATSASFAVTAIPTTTSVVANPTVATVGDPIVFNATVAPTFGTSTPTGTVQFVVNGAGFGGAIPLVDGQATSPALSTLPVALHNSVVAIYSGSGDHAASTSPAADFRVRNPLLGTTTTQTATPSTAVAGQEVTLSAHVARNSGGSDPLTGSVTFTSGGNTVATVGLDGNGDAQAVVTDLAVGNHSIVANYSGDDVYAGSASAPAGVSVSKADVSVVLSTADDTTVTGEAVNLTATVAAQSPSVGVPTGSVQLLVDGAASGSPVALSGGSATFPALTHLGAGNHTLAVTYPGNDSYKSGSDTQSQLVSPATTTTTVISGPSPQVEDNVVTITATVAAQAPGSGAPTGNVVFLSDGNVIGAASLAPAGGSAQAVLEIDTLAPGTHAITASYPGDADYVASGADAVEQKVVAAAAVVGTTTTVTSTKNPSTYGELITFSAHVAAADDTVPTGTIQFSVDGTDIGGPVAVNGNGDATSVTLASPEPGDHLVIAAYTPNAAYALSGAALTQTVQAAGVTVGLTSSNASSNQGQAVTFHATVSSDAAGTGTPGGFVQFRVDGFPFGPAVALDGDGEATSGATTSLTPGAHTVTAVYSGDAHFVAGNKSITQNVGQMGTSTALVASTTSPTYGDAVTFTATVTPASNALGAPTGTVKFLEGSTVLATVPVSAAGSTAKASFTTATFGAGAHAVKAVYSGATAFAGSTSGDTTVTVAKKATALKADAALVKLTGGLGLNLGYLKATLTSGGAPLPGQPVVFTIGTSTVCTSTTDGAGVATCNALPQLLALTLAGGYKATYAGSANYLGSSDNGTTLK